MVHAYLRAQGESCPWGSLPPPLAQNILFADKEVGAKIPGLTLFCVMKRDCLYTQRTNRTIGSNNYDYKTFGLARC